MFKRGPPAAGGSCRRLNNGVSVAFPFFVASFKVRLVADLSAAAFRSGQDKELALWYCLRSLNTTGSGTLPYELAIEGLQSVFGYSLRTALRHLALGEGQFWQRKSVKRGSIIDIYGVKQIALMFNTTLLGNIRFYEVPARKFQSLRYRRLALWSSIHKPLGVRANPISRDTLAGITGVQRRTQQLYDKAARIKKTVNFRPQHEQKRLPNSYHNRQDFGHRGQLAKIRRQLRSLLTAEALEKRRYFGSVPKMLKTKDRVDVSYVLTRSDKRQIRGRLEWEPISTMAM